MSTVWCNTGANKRLFFSNCRDEYIKVTILKYLKEIAQNCASYVACVVNYLG
jgi:hypothetical protein